MKDADLESVSQNQNCNNGQDSERGGNLVT